jgi:TonB-dependent SusC/RagA subfamily outer membrane receptor
VELIGPNGTILQKKAFKLTNGTAPGEFNLQNQSGKGIYSIRAYTNYMRNFDDSVFFETEIYVHGASEEAILQNANYSNKNNRKPDLQFFPEGGYLINGFLNPIGFKATDNNGYGIPVSGEILDVQGQVVKAFSSSHLGLGLFYFIPKKGNKYKALIRIEDNIFTYHLPIAINEGVLMTAVENDEHYKINMQATDAMSINGFKISGKQKQKMVFEAEVSTNEERNVAVVKVPKDILMEGIIELTLLDSTNKPVAERLLFHTAENNAVQSTITTSKSTYGPKSLVTLDIDLDQYDRENVSAELSLAVNNTKVLPDGFNTPDIKTYLLLNSELRGIIEQPGYYFYSNDPHRKKNLDLLMRTQGWRQYLNSGDLEESEHYFQPEVGLSLRGKVVSSLNPDQPLNGTVFLTTNNSEETVQDKVKTDGAGNFIFKDLNFIDATSVLLNADVHYPNNTNRLTANYQIVLDSIVSPEVSSVSQKPFLMHLEKLQRISETYAFNDNTIRLEEAFIEAEKVKTIDKFERKRKIVPYKEPSQTVDFENFNELGFINLLDALSGRVPGLTIRNSNAYLRGASSLSDNSSALVLLDGTPVGGDILRQMQPSSVDFVDVLKGPRTAIYGSRAANGVIAIFTKDGTETTAENNKFDGSLNFMHPGYDYSKKFYEPKYPQKLTSGSLDNRTTLHWQPNIKLNENGKAKVSFYTSDILGDYKVVMEGLTSEGIPIRTVTYLEVKI